MRYLSAEQIERAVCCEDLMNAVERAYAVEQAGSFHMPNRFHLDHQGNTVLYMPCFLERVFSTKILTLVPNNSQRGLPVISGLVLLNDATTGMPLAIMDGGAVTAYRTGAVSGLAIRNIASIDTKVAGLIGAGGQGFTQIIFANAVRKLDRVLIYDLDPRKSEKLVLMVRDRLPHLSVQRAPSVEALVSHADLVITATPATTPVLPDNKELLREKSYIAIGSYKPEMRELPQALYHLVDSILIDTPHGLEESGDLIIPLERGWIGEKQILPFGQFLTDHPKPRNKGETTLFKSVGMALFDLTVAESIYRKAIDQGWGIELE